MCFVEFIGYTCGHTSVPLNRECPMTTHLHSNPCCPAPATRPFLASEMCPPCARIIHGRWVQILEMEHRFMHERGACGCEVRFPALQQPRLVTATGAREDGTEGYSISNYATPYMTSQFPSSEASTSGGASQVPPLYQETQGQGTAGVAVRLPSLYAAEWTTDHAKLHESGNCKCRVRFQTYQSPLLEEYDEELKREAREELENKVRTGKGKQKAAPAPIADPVPQDRYAPTMPNHQQYRTTYPQANHPVSQSTYPELKNPTLDSPQPGGFSGYAQHDLATHSYGPPSSQAAASTRQDAAPHDHDQQQQYAYRSNPALAAASGLGVGQPARWACSPPDLYPLDAALGAAGPMAEQQAAHPVDLQPMSINWNQRRVPLASLPIGAGAEGSPHTAPFAECRLSREVRMGLFREQLAGGDDSVSVAVTTSDEDEDEEYASDSGSGSATHSETGLWAKPRRSSSPRRSRSTHF
ncbi:hypothetical protein F4809DRAFT_656947 [Biscogniauxia mediterranea]|nr:hypothetical protein F4809DRAFT_656947 [Biscogniauxia mediterranea]